MYSKETKNINLPQWTPNDHPDFLTDMNTAMETIDRAIGAVDENMTINNKKIAALNQSQDSTNQALAAINETLAGYPTINESIENINESINDLHTKNSNNSKTIVTMQAQITANTNSLSDVHQSIVEISKDIQTNTSNIEAVTEAEAANAAAINELEEKINSGSSQNDAAWTQSIEQGSNITIVRSGNILQLFFGTSNIAYSTSASSWGKTFTFANLHESVLKGMTLVKSNSKATFVVINSGAGVLLNATVTIQSGNTISVSVTSPGVSSASFSIEAIPPLLFFGIPSTTKIIEEAGSAAEPNKESEDNNAKNN